MTTEDAKKILETLAGFLNKNEGNKLNEWLSVPLMNAVRANLEEIINKDATIAREEAKVAEPLEDTGSSDEISKLKYAENILGDEVR